MPLPALSALVADANVAEATRLVEQDGSLASELSWESLTPLHWACTGPGCVELCTVLLRAGADANAANTWGSTPLHYAAYGNHLECVRVLLEGGARLDVVDQDGRTPRQDAEGRGHLQVVDLLRERGGSGGSGDLIGFGDGDGSAPPVVAAPPGDAAKEKWQEAQKKVTLMKAGVAAFQSSAPEAAGEDEKAVPPPAVGTQPPEPVDPGEAAKQRGNEAMKSEKYNQAVSHCESDRPLGRADTGTDRHCADRHRGAADGADQPRLLLEPQVRPRPRHL